jgi:hypothetical protein
MPQRFPYKTLHSPFFQLTDGFSSHRAQTLATLPMLVGALYWSAEGDLTAGAKAPIEP